MSQSEWEKRKQRAFKNSQSTTLSSAPIISSTPRTGTSAGSSGSEWEKRKQRAMQSAQAPQPPQTINRPAAASGISSRDDWYRVYRGRVGNQQAKYQKLRTLLDTIDDYDIADVEQVKADLTGQLEEIQASPEYRNSVYARKHAGKTSAQLGTLAKQATDPGEKSWLEYVSKATESDEDRKFRIARNTDEKRRLEAMMAEAPDTGSFLKSVYTSTPASAGTQNAMQKDEIAKKYGYSSWKEATDRLDAIKREMYFDQNARKYDAVKTEADFAEKSQYDESKGKGVEAGEHAKYNRLNQADMEGTKVGPNLLRDKYDYMTEEDLATYNYIYNTEGKEAAEDYLDYMSYHYNELRQYGIQQDVASFMDKGLGDTWIGGALASNASVPLKLASGIAMVDVVGQKIRNAITGEDRPVDFNTGAWTARSLSNGLREGTAQNLNEFSGTVQLDPETHPILAHALNGKGLGDVYSLGMSMADSGVVAALSPIIGPTGVALLATSAGADGIQTALENGATDDQAITMGLINATAEALFEKVSLDNLIKSDPKKLITSMLQQGLVEGSEEASTSVANAIGDAVIMAEKSEWKKDIAEYMNAGDDVKTATWKAFWGKVMEVGMDFVGGVISGGLMGGGSTVIQNTQARMQYGDQAGSLLEDAARYGVDTKATQKAQKRMEAEKPVPGSTIRQVMSQTEDAKASKAETYASEAAQMLADLGQEVDVTETAQAISKALTGQQLTQDETATIERSDMAPIVFAEMQIRHAITDNIAEAAEATEGTTTDAIDQSIAETAQEAQRAKTPEAMQVEGEAEKVAHAENLPAETEVEAVANEEVAEEEYQPEVLEEDAASVDAYASQYANPAAYKATFQGNQDPAQYDVAYRAAYEMGMNSEPVTQMQQSKSVQYLTPEQQIDAYREGEAAAKAQATAEDAFLRSKGQRTGGRKRGNVKAMGGVNIQTLTSKFNDSQRKAYRILDRIAEVTGINIVLYESQVGENGKFEGEQGRFARSTPDTIYIDINAGLSGVSDVGNMAKYTMLATFSHEFTHFCETWNPIRYNELRKLVFDTMESKGVSVEDRIDALMQEDSTLTRDGASREVVAEAMVDILPDANFIETLATKHQSLFQKLLERLKEFLASIRDLFNGMEKSEYASVLKEELDGTVRYMESIVKLFDNVAVEAVETMQESILVADTMSNTEAFADSAIAVQNQIRPPYNEGTKAFNAFADSLSEEARKTFDLFYGFYDLSRITNATNLQGKTVKKINISAPFVSVTQWNDKVRNDAKWGETAKRLAAFLDEGTRKRMNMNEDGTLNETPLERAFKMQKSIAQRLVDSLPVEDIDAEYTIDDSVTITLPTAKARQSVGGEAYRRALIGETRKLYHEGKLKQVSIGTMSKDRWGSLGFLAANGKTTASGDFTTVCPQMMFNKGCFYCYRRAAMESGVNNKLVAEKVWYAGEILRIKDKDIEALNRNGGLRIQSFGDWMPHFSAMLADVLYDAELRGLQVKIITKEPSMIEYLASLKDQGIGKNLYFNLSADYVLEKAPVANNTGGPDSLEHINPDRPFVRRDGQAWWKRAMAVEEAAKYRAKYDWVNTRIVATTTEEFIRGLKDPTVDVVTGYHGNIRQYDRIDSVTGQTQVEVEALGDAGMPRWVFLDGKWNLVYKGKTKTHQQLAERVQAEGLELEYYAKTCCQTGRCSECEGKCGKMSRSMTMKNATNRDEESVSYWRTMQNIQDESLEISREEWEAMGGTQFQRRQRQTNNDDFWTTMGVHWVEQEGILTDKEVRAVWEAIANYNSLDYNLSRTSDERIFVESGTALILVNPDYMTPAIEAVFRFKSDSETDMFDAKELLINAQGTEEGTRYALKIIENARGEGYVESYDIRDYTSYGRKNRSRKRDYSSLFAEEVREDGEVDSQKQRRSAPKMSDLEVLEMAAEGLEGLSLSEAEQKSLAILQKKLAALAPISAEIEIHERKAEDYAESDPDLATEERKRATTLKAKRTREASKILAGANGPFMRKVLQKARSLVESSERAEYREKLDKIRAEHREAEQAKLAEYRAKRHESELAKRHKMRIRKTIMDLDKLLNRGTKQANVKEEMRDLVSGTLRAAEVLFLDEYTAADMVRNGVGVELSDRESEHMQKAKDIMAQMNALTGSPDDVMQKRNELQKKLDYQLSQMREVFQRERKRLYAIHVEDVVNDLSNMYRKLTKSENGYIQAAFDENVAEYLQHLNELIGAVPVRDMNAEQLDNLSAAFTMILHKVRTANKAFAENIRENIETLAYDAITEEAQKKKNKYQLPAVGSAQAFWWNNEKPGYAMERIGSKTMTKLYNNVANGENTFAQDIADAKSFKESVAKKYGMTGWDFKTTKTFRSSSGLEFELNLGQIMSLYAYAKREAAHDHITKGGIVFPPSTKVRKKVGPFQVSMKLKDATAYNISDDLLQEILSDKNLTQEQKSFVDDMQDYLSSVMGAKGNEVSMAMYGVRQFGEQNYFPIRVDSRYTAKAEETEMKKQSGQATLASAGFTKATVPHASNPIILEGFMDVWAAHVNDMSLYHSFVLPLADFQRVFNFNTPHMEGGQSKSVKAAIANAHGEAATNYIRQLLSDINGGVVTDSRDAIVKKMISRFKKAAVVASASVVVQQPSALFRAKAMIDPKYFGKIPVLRGVGALVQSTGRVVFTHKQHTKLWEQAKKYAPGVVTIKDIGGFDTATGQGIESYLANTDREGFKSKVQGFLQDPLYRSGAVDAVLGYLPAVADEMAWVEIWLACKRETMATHKGLKWDSEEMLKISGERFTEVIRKTQVYDSVFSKSSYMRSKSTTMAMLTSFMAEPTTTINMVEEMVMNLGKKNFKPAAKTAAAVLQSIVINNLLRSLVYAMRDDDDDETYLEKYAEALTSGVMDDLNPLNYYPYLRDINSILTGYDVERTDVSIVSEVADKLKKVMTLESKDIDKMDEEELAEHNKAAMSAWFDLAGSISSLFGFPGKNIKRTITSVINTWEMVTTPKAERYMNSSNLWNKVREGINESRPFFWQLETKDKRGQLYEAMVSGDAKMQNRLQSGYKDESAFHAAIRKALRENDPRIKEAAQARYDGDIAEYTRLAKEIRGEKHFVQDDIVAAIDSEVALFETDGDKSDPKAKGLYKASDFAAIAQDGEWELAAPIIEDMVATKVKNGQSQKNAESNTKSSIKKELKEDVFSGDLSKENAIHALTLVGDLDKDEASAQYQDWMTELEHGYSNDEVKGAYLAGDITQAKAIEIRMEYTGKSRAETAEEVAKWEAEKSTGYAYDDIKEAFLDGELTSGEAMAKYKAYGVKDADARDKVTALEFQQKWPGTDGISASAVKKYQKYCAPVGVSGTLFYQVHEFEDDAHADVDKNGNSINGTKRKKVLKYIDSLPLNTKQKDAIYYAFGWAPSTLDEAPWH